MSEKLNSSENFKKKTIAILASAALFMTGCGKSDNVEAQPSPTSETTRSSIDTPTNRPSPTPTPEASPSPVERHRPVNEISLDEALDYYRNIRIEEVQSWLANGEMNKYADLMAIEYLILSENLAGLTDMGHCQSSERNGMNPVFTSPRNMDAKSLFCASIGNMESFALAQTDDGTATIDEQNEPINPELALKAHEIFLAPLMMQNNQYSDDGGAYARDFKKRHKSIVEGAIEDGTINTIGDQQKASEKAIIEGTGTVDIKGKTYDVIYMSIDDVNYGRVTAVVTLIPVSKGSEVNKVYMEGSTRKDPWEDVDFNTPRYNADGNSITADGEPVEMPVIIGYKTNTNN